VVEIMAPERVEPIKDEVTMMSELPPEVPTPELRFKIEPDRE
jgi:hypothetical protein